MRCLQNADPATSVLAQCRSAINDLAQQHIGVHGRVGVEREAVRHCDTTAPLTPRLGQRQPLLNGLLLHGLVLVVSQVSLGLAQHPVQHSCHVVVRRGPQHHRLAATEPLRLGHQQVEVRGQLEAAAKPLPEAHPCAAQRAPNTLVAGPLVAASARWLAPGGRPNSLARSLELRTSKRPSYLRLRDPTPSVRFEVPILVRLLGYGFAACVIGSERKWGCGGLNSAERNKLSIPLHKP